MSRYKYNSTTGELELIAGNAYYNFVAPKDSSPTTAPHAKGSHLIYGNVLYEATSNIAVGANLVVYPTSGYNVKAADTLTEEIDDLAAELATTKQALTKKLSQGDAVTLSDFMTIESRLTITSSSITKTNNHIHAELVFSGSVTSDAYGTVTIGSVKSGYIPTKQQIVSTMCNDSTTSLVYAPAVARITVGGAVYLFIGIANHTFGNASIPWSTSLGIILDYWL